jgi:hypothetical protein
VRGVIVAKFTPTDFEAWRAFHHAQLPMMKSQGAISDRVYRDASGTGELVVITEVADLEQFLAFLGSPEFTAIASASPVAGPPEVTIGEFVEQPI